MKIAQHSFKQLSHCPRCCEVMTVRVSQDNGYWTGLERLRRVERIIKSDLSDGDKQHKIAEMFCGAFSISATLEEPKL